jgi:FkbM family methyltransferase
VSDAAIRFVDTPGGRVYVSDADQGSVARALRTKGRYERDWTAWMRAHVTPGMHVIDIGANVGYYTMLLASLVGPEGHVIACEPDPGNAALLRRGVAENQLPQVRVVEAAVTDAEGRATLHQDPAWHGVHSLARENCVNPGEAHVDVATTTVDALLAGTGRDADFVKIDAQGAEAGILRAANRLLTQVRARVLMELWPFGVARLGGTLDDVVLPFLDHGFAAWKMGPSRELMSIDRTAIGHQAAALGQWSSFNLLWMK